MTSSLMVYRRKKKHQPSAIVLRKYRRLRRRRIGLKKEYKKLKALLPHKEKEKELKKVGVVEAAYRYICELQDALLDKFSTKGVPQDLAGVVHGKVTSAADIQALAIHLIKSSSSSSVQPVLSRPSTVNNGGAGGVETGNTGEVRREGDLSRMKIFSSQPKIPSVPQCNSSLSSSSNNISSVSSSSLTSTEPSCSSLSPLSSLPSSSPSLSFTYLSNHLLPTHLSSSPSSSASTCSSSCSPSIDFSCSSSSSSSSFVSTSPASANSSCSL